MDGLLILVTIVVGPAMLIGAGGTVWKLSAELQERSERWGCRVGGALGLAAMTFLGFVEAVLTGVHPVTLWLMAYGYVAVLGGMGLGTAAGWVAGRLARPSELTSER